MKPIHILMFSLVLFSACTKEGGNKIYYKNLLDSLNSANSKAWNNWCGHKLAAWGDSFLADWGNNYDIPMELGGVLGIDSIIVTANSRFLQHKDSMVFNNAHYGETSFHIRSRFNSDTSHRDWPTIICAGRNNYPDYDVVISDIAQMVAGLKTDKYIIMAIHNGAWATEWKGTDAYIALERINITLENTYGKHFYKPKTILMQQAQKGNYWDSVCVEHDVLPISMRLKNDSMHFSERAITLIATDIATTMLQQCKPLP